MAYTLVVTETIPGTTVQTPWGPKSTDEQVITHSFFISDAALSGLSAAQALAVAANTPGAQAQANAAEKSGS